MRLLLIPLFAALLCSCVAMDNKDSPKEDVEEVWVLPDSPFSRAYIYILKEEFDSLREELEGDGLNNTDINFLLAFTMYKKAPDSFRFIITHAKHLKTLDICVLNKLSLGFIKKILE